jgi:hypothetical protein
VHEVHRVAPEAALLLRKIDSNVAHGEFSLVWALPAGASGRESRAHDARK